MPLPYARHLAGGGGPGRNNRSPNAFTRSDRQRRRALEKAAAKLPKNLTDEARHNAISTLRARFGL